MIINKNTYPTPDLNFSTMCALEEDGVDIPSLSEKPFQLVLLFATLAIGDKSKAAHELDEHFKNGGDLEALANEIKTAFEKSGFMKSTATPVKPSKAKKTLVETEPAENE